MRKFICPHCGNKETRVIDIVFHTQEEFGNTLIYSNSAWLVKCLRCGKEFEVKEVD